jgi:hypothetical protein
MFPDVGGQTKMYKIHGNRAHPTVKIRMQYSVFLSQLIRETALIRRRIIDTLTSGTIGMLMRFVVIKSYILSACSPR